MAIEKRTLPGGAEVGFDTETKHYCPIPKNMVNEASKVDYSVFTIPQLEKLADEQGIDLGEATRKDDIIAKIKGHFTGNQGY